MDLVAHILTELHQLGVSLSDAHVHCQLDNTASTNKNNTLLLFLAAMVAAGLICTFTANFLRVGHTHEDIDQFFGELAKWVKKRLHYAQCLAEFKMCTGRMRSKPGFALWIRSGIGSTSWKACKKVSQESWGPLRLECSKWQEPQATLTYLGLSFLWARYLSDSRFD